MDMSSAALPPRSGYYDKKDEAHPLFQVYREKLNSCAQLMINAPDFKDWLYQHEHQAMTQLYTEHPRYQDFLNWMRENKAGRRPCCPSATMPQGVAFPVNFEYWLIGGRW